VTAIALHHGQARRRREADALRLKERRDERDRRCFSTQRDLDHLDP
jgi:hypothetical protein